MDWLAVVLLIFVCVVLIALAIIVVCMSSEQGCTISCQQRSTKPNLTKKQRQQMEQEQSKSSSLLKRIFRSSKDGQSSSAPQDVKLLEFTFKPANEKKDPETVTTVDESSTVPFQLPRESPAEREARRKRHEEIRRKYKL